MTIRKNKRLGFQVHGEELESRAMLAGHAVAAAFPEPILAAASMFSGTGESLTAHDQFFGGFGASSSSHGTEFTASLTDSGGDTATVTYQTGNLLGTSAAVITVTGDTSAAGTSVPVTINGVSIGTVAINSSGGGTLIVPASSVATTVDSGSTAMVGGLNGTFAASSTNNNGGCMTGQGNTFTASVSDSGGDTATVTYQIGRLLGTSETVVTVTGDTSAEGTTVPVTINGTAVGTVAIDSSGAGTLIVPTSSLSLTVAAGSTVMVGSLNGSFAAATGTSHDHESSQGHELSAMLTDSGSDTATVTYQTGKLLGTSEAVITVTGDTSTESTSAPVVINGVAVGTVSINASGAGTLILPTSSIATTVAAGSSVSVGGLNGTFAATTSSAHHSGWGQFRHGWR